MKETCVIVLDCYDKQNIEETISSLEAIGNSSDVYLVSPSGTSIPGIKTLKGSQVQVINSFIHKKQYEFYAFITAGSFPAQDWLDCALKSFDNRTGVVASRIDIKNPLTTEVAESKTCVLPDASSSHNHILRSPGSAQASALCPCRYDFSYTGGVFEWLKTFLSGKLCARNNCREVFFGSFAGLVMRGDAFIQAKGFDFEGPISDIDLFWRINLLGWKVAYEENSRVALSLINFINNEHELALNSPVYSSIAGPIRAKASNALCVIYKNLASETMHTGFIPAMHLLSVLAEVDTLPRSESAMPPRLQCEHEQLSTHAARKHDAHAVHASESLSGKCDAVFLKTPVNSFVDNIVAIERKRQEVQKTRVIPDHNLFRLIQVSQEHSAVLKVFGSEVIRRTRVLVITPDRVGRSMAGPAIRAWNISEVLSRLYEVRLVSSVPSESLDAPFEIFYIGNNQRQMAIHEKWADVIVFQGHILSQFPLLRRTKKFLIADVYDPMHLEQLEQAKNSPIEVWRAQFEGAASALEQQFLLADYFVCASERQRHFYLGQLMSAGKVSVEHYQEDPHLRNLIDVVPFGLSSVSPKKTRVCLRGVYPGIAENDKILIWAGGIYNWFDTETLIMAVADLSQRRDSVRLFFQGTKHPNPAVPEMSVVAQSRSLAQACNILDKYVFFNDTWVDYDDRQNYLLESDAGVTTHFDHVETTFSFRTRVLDYLWAGLPMVITDGDVFAQYVKEYNLGLVVEQGNVRSLADALEKILFDQDFILACKRNIEEFRRRFFWEEVLRPLIRRIDVPHTFKVDTRTKRDRKRIDNMPWGSRRNLALVRYYYRAGGVKMVFRKIVDRIRFLFGSR